MSDDVNAAKQGAADASDSFNKQIESNYYHTQDYAPPPESISKTPSASAFGTPSNATASAFGKQQDDQLAARQAQQQAAASQWAPATQASRMGMLGQGKSPTTQAPGGLQPGLYAAPQPGNRIGLNPDAVNAPAGSKDLESSLGANAWGKLLGDTQHAQGEAGALGSQSGVQGLIQQSAAQPLAQNGAFDAALEYGQGQKQFGDTAKAGAGLLNNLQNDSTQSQAAWHSLMGDVDQARREQAAIPAPATAQGAQGQAPQYDQAKLDQDVRDSRDKVAAGIAAYSDGPGKSGGVNTLGDRDEFMAAMNNGSSYGDGMKWENSPTVQQQTDAACKALGITQDQFMKDVQRMNDEEYQNFWLLGVIPTWMDVGQAYGKGTVGGWQSPFIKQVTSYGSDGGMWNALTNTWKDGVITFAEGVAGGPSGAVKAAAKAATYSGPGAGKK